jgi:hypothetical protein
MDRSPEDAVDRLLREALGEPTGAAPIRDLDELFGLLNDAGVTGPVVPRPEDYAGLPPVADDATEEDAAEAYRLAQAAALLRLAREEKERRDP